MKLNQYQWDPENDKRGEGSFAEVFEAKDNNGDSVALKVYRDSVVQSGSEGSFKGKYSLENEFSKGKHLSHTNVIRYIGLDYLVHVNVMQKESSFPVLIMEYADAGSLEMQLSGALAAGGMTVTSVTVLDETAKLKIVRELLEGMGYLHEQGIIHRDLKPGNILFKTDRTGKRVVKITDFGISRDSLAKNTGATTFGLGTISYMAPEQFLPKAFGLDETVSNRTDIWAFGVIFYRLLTGRLPFSSQEQITDAEPDLTQVPARYRNLIRTCLQKHASKRYASAKEVLLDLEKQHSDHQIKPPARLPKKALIITVAAILVAAVAFWGFRVWKAGQPVYVTDMSLQLADTTKTGINILYYSYTGWMKNGVPDGQGTKTYKDGRKYVGESKNGHADGKGTMYYKVDGGNDVYVGDFKNGRPNGTGTYTYADSDKYVGDFKNGIKEGHGTFYVNRNDRFKGDKYVGDYANDTFNGDGTYEWRNGQHYTGQFQNGQMHGKGKLTYSDGGVYEGDMVNGRRQGQGTMNYADNSRYIGSWDEDKRNGSGTLYYADRKKYEGDFKNDLRDGNGTLTFADGSKYVGPWVNDGAEGYGKIYDGNGTLVQSGYYVNGKYQQ